MFKNKTFNFKKTNLITGPNASGKTLLLKALQGITQNTEDKVTIEISSKKTKNINKDFTECILLDMPFARYTKKTNKNFLKWLKNKYKNLQLIITSLREIKGFNNYIKLKRPYIEEDYERIRELEITANNLALELFELKAKKPIKRAKIKETEQKIAEVKAQLEEINNEIASFKCPGNNLC